MKKGKRKMELEKPKITPLIKKEKSKSNPKFQKDVEENHTNPNLESYLV